MYRKIYSIFWFYVDSYYVMYNCIIVHIWIQQFLRKLNSTAFFKILIRQILFNSDSKNWFETSIRNHYSFFEIRFVKMIFICISYSMNLKFCFEIIDKFVFENNIFLISFEENNNEIVKANSPNTRPFVFTHFQDSAYFQSTPNS